MSHLLKFKEFYERKGLGFRQDDKVPTANCICIYCRNSGTKLCDKSCCKTGQECENFEPSSRMEKDKLVIEEKDEEGKINTRQNDEVVDPATIDYTKDYFKREPTKVDLLEEEVNKLKSRIAELEARK